MNIRYGTIADAQLLSELGARTFYDTFAEDNTPENMAAYLKRSFSPEIQLKELAEPSVIFLIAELDGIPIGYAQLMLDSKDEVVKGLQPLEIRRIYASQKYLGKGVGKELMQATIREAQQRNCDCLWLGVWEKIKERLIFIGNGAFVKWVLISFLLEMIRRLTSSWN